jgi:hypothetical protein
MTHRRESTLLVRPRRSGAVRRHPHADAGLGAGDAEGARQGKVRHEIGADYLIARTGRGAEREAAEDLSEALGGLPLAHEQATAFCERLEIPLAEYRRRFTAAPVQMLDTPRDAPAEYHDKLTVAKTFALAIEEAGKLHPAAEPLLVHAALLAPEPIPLFLFAEAREKFGEPLASVLAGDGLDEAVANLRAFALVDREQSSTSATRQLRPTRCDCTASCARSQDRYLSGEISADAE